MAKSSNKSWIGRLAFSLFSLVFFAVGAGILYANYSFMQNAEETVGTVIHVSINRDDDGTTYKPTVKFTVDGRDYEAQSWMSSSGYDFSIGEKIPVLYDVDDPQSIRLNYFMEKWGFGGIFATIGAVMFIIGTFVGRKRKPKRRKPKPVEPTDYKPRPTDPEPGDVPARPTRNPTVRRR